MNAWLRVWHKRFLLRGNTVPIFLNSIIYSSPFRESISLSDEYLVQRSDASSTGQGSDHEPDVE